MHAIDGIPSGDLITGTVSITTQVLSNTSAFKRVLEVALYSFRLIGALKGLDGVPVPLKIVATVVDDAIDFIDGVQTLPDGIALAQIKINSENFEKIGFMSAFFAADLMGVVLFLEKNQLLDLARHSAIIGGKYVFVKLLNGVVGVGHAFLIADLVKNDWAKAEKENDKMKKLVCILKISRSAVEIFAKTFAIFGPQLLFFVGITAAGPAVFVVAPLALGLLSASLGWAAFVTEKMMEKK